MPWTREQLDEQFRRYTSPPDERGCINWTGRVNRGGYGEWGQPWRERPSSKRAHRVAWELASGPVPDGLLICHSCDNRRCVNREHLFAGTHRDNMIDAIAKGRIRLAVPKLAKRPRYFMPGGAPSRNERRRARYAVRRASGWQLPCRNRVKRVKKGGVGRGRLLPTHSMPGAAHWKAKLTDADVLFIRAQPHTEATYRALAPRLGVSVRTIGKIARREGWKHLP